MKTLLEQALRAPKYTNITIDPLNQNARIELAKIAILLSHKTILLSNGTVLYFGKQS